MRKQWTLRNGGQQAPRLLMHDLTRQAPPEARNSSTPKRLQHLQRRRRPAGLNDDDAEVQCEALRLLRLLLRRQPLLFVTAAVDVMGAGVVTIYRLLVPEAAWGTHGAVRRSWVPCRATIRRLRGGCEKCCSVDRKLAWRRETYDMVFVCVGLGSKATWTQVCRTSSQP